MVRTVGLCAACGSGARCRQRDISLHAWMLLLNWGDIERKTVNQAICDTCYDELRDLLIDRSDELEALFSLNKLPKGKLTENPNDLVLPAELTSQISREQGQD